MEGDFDISFLYALLQTVDRIHFGEKIKAQLTKLKLVVRLLKDAEEREWTDNEVNQSWSSELQHLELRDLVHKARELLFRMIHEASWPKSPKRKLWYLISGKKKLEKELRDITNSLQVVGVQFLAKRIHINSSLSDRMESPLPSLLSKEEESREYNSDNDEEEEQAYGSDKDEMEEPQVHGRHADKEAIINLLLSKVAIGKDIEVIAIEGVAGVGKTTLAQLVYNDKKVKDHFDLQGRAPITKHFNVAEVMKTILQAINMQPSASKDLPALEDELKERIKGKRFLLVLDDVWSVNSAAWDTLMSPLRVGANGSKIIVTTCQLYLEPSLGVSRHHFLRPLEDRDCWNILADAVFKRRDTFHRINPEVERFGRKIANNCRGLPTVAKGLGALLRFLPRTPQEWRDVWKNLAFLMPNDDQAFHLLMPSYDGLHPHLKPCFAYCSLLPLGCHLENAKIVNLWMAADLLSVPRGDPNNKLEDVGHQYLKKIISRNFFQQSFGDKSRFTMDNLTHNLARYVSKGSCFTMEDNEVVKIPYEVLHFSFICGKHDLNKILYAISDADFLETFLPFYPPSEHANVDITNEQLNNLFSRFQHLRVLSLSHYRITQLPDLVKKLKHLRYLDLSHTPIEKLPDSVCALYKLQTLLLSNCPVLAELPDDFMELLNLRYLDLSHTQIRSLPASVCALHKLQILLLSNCPLLTELPDDFNDLLSLWHLDLSQTAIKSLPASVCALHKLQNLLLSKCPALTDLPNEFMKLLSLQHLDLSHTPIKSLPDSVCTLHQLQILRLSNCPFFTQLPTEFWKLRNLHHLDISGTPLKEMPPEMSKLQSLQNLTNFVVGGYSGSTIKELGALSSLHETLCISELQNVIHPGEASEASLARKFHLDGLVLRWSNSTVDSQNDAVVLDQLRPYTNLKELTIEFYRGKRFPRWLGDSSFSNILFLCLSNCEYCPILPPLGQLPSLRDLIIEGLKGIQRVGSEFYGTDQLMRYSIKPFQSLKTLKFEGMLGWEEWTAPELASGELFPRLQKLYIVTCPKLKSEIPGKLSRFKLVEVQECVELDSTLNEQRADKGDKVQLGNDYGLPSQSSKHGTGSPIISNTEREGSPKSLSYELQSHVDDKVQLKGDNRSTSRSSERKAETSVMSGIGCERISKSPTYEMQSPEGDTVLLRSEEDDLTSRPFELRTELPSTSSAEHAGASRHPNYMAQIENEPETDALINTSNGQDSSEDESTFETFLVSEISELMYLPSGLRSLKIESCETQESLPDELMSSSRDLRHLHVIDCHSLKSFPRGQLPTTLKMLYISHCRKLEFILPADKMPQYVALEHLCLGSSCDSLVSFPLASFPKLKSFSIWDCPNFASISVPTEGIAFSFRSLEAIEIRDCPKMESFPKGGLPTPNLISIFLSNCKNLKALPELLNLLRSLQSLSINKCPELKSLPDGGLPSNLSLLRITSCNKLVPLEDWGLHELMHLKSLEIESECGEMKSFPEETMLPCNLNSLRIGKFLNLESLNYKGLRQLTRLETLEISCCDKLQSLPKEGLPPSLSSLCITECPSLTSRLQHKKGRDWYKIARIPHIQIDDEAFR